MRLLVLLSALLIATASWAADLGYQKDVAVKSPTRLDWIFVLANQSLPEAPAEWLGKYDSTNQRYDYFAPEKPAAPKEGRAAILFISAGNEPAGWKNFEATCRKQGIVFASPHGAGNNTPMPQRVRIILDVLDDLRQREKIDPDRTYIAGFSGGGRVACAIAFALPEVFGGVIPVCAGGELREEQWLRHRVADRLSVAFLTGANDFNRGEIERLRSPLLSAMGVRTKATVTPGLGHGIPNDKVCEAAIKWLDEAAPARRKLADKYPASRLKGDAVPSREAASQLLLEEALARAEQREARYSGLMQLMGIRTRWADLPAAQRALEVLTKYERDPDRAWEEEDIAEQRRALIARARGLDAYGSGDLPAQYAKQRPDMLQAAIELWKQVIADGADKAAVAEAQRRIPALEKLIKDK